MAGDVLKIATSVGTPIGLAGLVLGVLYLVYSLILKGKLSKILPAATAQLLNRIARYMFILALVGMVLGIGAYLFVTYTTNAKPLDACRTDYDMGVSAYQNGQYNEAIAYMSKVHSDCSTYRSAVSYIGASEFRLGNYARALTAYDEAVRVSTTRRQKLDSQFNVALMDNFVKDYAEAEKLLSPMLNTLEMADDRSVIFNDAFALYYLGKVAQAEEVFAKFPLNAPVPGDPDSHDLFAKAHDLRAGFIAHKKPLDCEKVRSEVEMALAIEPLLKDKIAEDKSLAACIGNQGAKKMKPHTNARNGGGPKPGPSVPPPATI